MVTGGRPLRVQPQTLAWLERYKLRWDLLIMRHVGDYSAAREFKQDTVYDLRTAGFDLRLACPEPLCPPQNVVDWARREGGRVSLLVEPDQAVAGADCVVADTWVSMGVEASVNRHNLLAPYRVDERLMAKAKPDAIFMHCLPAKRGEEVTAGVIDGPQSVVWDEAENRLHVQKGILAWCLG